MKYFYSACISDMIGFFKIYFHRAAHEAGAATAIVNVGVTRADDFVPLKINARLGEVWLELILTGNSEYCMFITQNLTSIMLCRSCREYLTWDPSAYLLCNDNR